MTLRALLVVAVLAALSSLPASAIVDGSVRVSLDYQGNQLAGPSGSVFGSPALSGDGNLVAFESAGQSLPQDTNGTSDVLFRDLDERPVSLVSVGVDGGAGNNRSYAPSISSDGRYVAFESMATDLIEGDGNGMPDVYLRDREEETTVRVSAPGDGADANGPSAGPIISGNGSSVAFCSRATNLSDDDNTSSDAFVYNVGAGDVIRVAPPEGASGEGCRRVALSSDAQFLAYTYTRTSGAGAGISQVYRTDLTTGDTLLISAAADRPGDAASGAESLAISDGGGTIVFASRASDLVAGDSNDAADVFLWQAADGSLTRVSVAPDGSEGDGDSGLIGVDVSGDARYVVYSSSATNLIPNDHNAVSDIFRLDRDQGETRLGSATASDRAPNGASYSPAVSDDGRAIAFVSVATDVVYGDRNRQPDVFMRAGVFPDDANLPAPTEDAGTDDGVPVVVRSSDEGGVPSAAVYGGIGAAVALVLIGGWFLLGRTPQA